MNDIEYHPHYPEIPSLKQHSFFSKEFLPVSLRRSQRRRNSQIRIELVRKHPFCKYCGKKLELQNSTLDHVVPRSKGGSNKIDNLVLSCSPCNNAKADKIL